MKTQAWLRGALAAIALLTSVDEVLATPKRRYAPHFDFCPARCSTSGPNSGNWSAYPNFNRIRRCEQTMFYDFNIYDPVDDAGVNHRILACSSYGPDFSNMPASTSLLAKADSVDVDYEIGWWNPGFGLAGSGIRSLVKQTRQYLDKGHGVTDKPLIMFAKSGQATIGLYIGQGLQNQGLSSSALKSFEDYVRTMNSSTPSLAMQLCQPGYDSTHIFGLMALSNGTFNPIQAAVRGWANATCLSFSESTKIPAQAMFTTPLLKASNLTVHSNTTDTGSKRWFPRAHLEARADCSTIQVNFGDSCGTLAQRCGISGADFTTYNPGSDFCAKLVPKQHVCCSKGDLPDFKPSKNSDGSCFTYQVVTDDNCANIAVENDLTNDDLEDLNKNTWGWSGCDRLLVGTIMCLSDGTPPFPAPMAGALCGPQVPGTEKPDDDTDISTLNPCPLNACCDVWGQCGITKEFCTDTSTGAPGTAKNGTNGCISNCGTEIVMGSGDGSQRVAYFEGYGLGRECLFQDALQVSDQFTHVHFGFGVLTADYEVQVGDALSSYEFETFKRIKSAKKVLSFGGWDFSTSPATYTIFREGVTAANRLKMATNIANFIKANDLDGVDIDWEYPGAPDIPNIPAASTDDGANYLAFLAVLKNLLGEGKTVSIAAPASYWYLRGFPISSISKIVDYIVFMTYDLHGQWDADNAWSQEGCTTGNCLRSQVNLTETQTALAMITKAGVPGNKIVVGVTSYGRSFRMADAGCFGPDCLFTGSMTDSQATKGICTGTAGYISDAEIYQILADESRVNQHYLDSTSSSNVLVYDDVQWVAYMDPEIKSLRQSIYSAWGMAGTTDWASDLEAYHDVPHPSSSWAVFKGRILAGVDPEVDQSRNGDWTNFTCSDPHIVDDVVYYPSDRWKALDAEDAWQDIVRIWNSVDKANDRTFSESVALTLKLGKGVDCGSVLSSSNCFQAISCESNFDSPYSGPAGQLIWNSFVRINQLYTDYHQGLYNALTVVTPALQDFEDKFAPIPPEEEDPWIDILFDLVTEGLGSVAGPFFQTFLKKLPYFIQSVANNDEVKETALGLIDQGTSIVKDLFKDTGDSQWGPGDQASFSNYLGRSVDAWTNSTSLALQHLFDGSEDSINLLYKTITDGKLIEGKRDGPPPNDNSANDLQADLLKTIFGFAIPTIWDVSGTSAFVLDSGAACGQAKLDDYLDDDTMQATGSCYNGQQYYLVEPKGIAVATICIPQNGNSCPQGTTRNQKFSAPPGIDSLTDTNFGGITIDNLIQGSLRTYQANGNKNGASFPDAANSDILSNLMDADITAPGLIRIPVCSPEVAFTSWAQAKGPNTPNWPCDAPIGIDDCGDSTFENDTNDSSPLVSDCLDIIKHIEGDPTTDWTTETIGQKQRDLAYSGTCTFHVRAYTVDGNVDFFVGGQDVIDIINESISRFAGGGDRVAAHGRMGCNGDTYKQEVVDWKIYTK